MSLDNLSANVTRAASPVGVNSLAEVREAITGKVSFLTAADGTKFEKEVCSWNFDVAKHTPDTLIQPKTTDEVSIAIAAASKFCARLVIAGGRHGHDCLAEGAIVLDLSKMKAVKVDQEQQLVTVEGGCKLGDMDKACQPYGLGCVTGTNPDTGVVGLSTAGGGGYLTRWHGMAVDNFVAATIVLASGEAVTATKENAHADLLWGIGGAGSNFGVITELTMRAYPVGHVYGGLMINTAFTKRGADGILANWRDWITDAPRSVMSMAVLPCGAPVVPMVIVETDKTVVPQGPEGAKVGLRQIPSFCSLGRIGAFGSLLSIKQTKRMDYHLELQGLLEPMQTSGHYYDASCLVPKLSAEVIATLTEFTRSKPVNKIASIIIFPMGGAVSDVALNATSFYGGGRLTSAFWIIIEGKFEPDADGANRAAVVDWVKRLRAALSKFDVSDTAHTLDGNMESELAGARAIFGPNLEKLRAVKAKYDPANFFRCNRNIAPGE